MDIHNKIKIKELINLFTPFNYLLMHRIHVMLHVLSENSLATYFTLFLIVNSVNMDFHIIFITQNLPTFSARFFFPLHHVDLQAPVCFKGFATNFAYFGVYLVMSCKIKKRTETNCANFTVVLPCSIFIVRTTCVSFHVGPVLERPLTMATRVLGVVDLLVNL